MSAAIKPIVTMAASYSRTEQTGLSVAPRWEAPLGLSVAGCSEESEVALPVRRWPQVWARLPVELGEQQKVPRSEVALARPPAPQSDLESMRSLPRRKKTRMNERRSAVTAMQPR